MSIRYHNADPVELEFAFRSLPDGGSTFEGYAAVFNRSSKVLHDALSRRASGYRETILPGAFQRSIRQGKRITFVVDHDERQMVSSAPTGALRLSEDSKGLHIESPWPRTVYTDSVRALHDSGERLGMSVLFGTTMRHEQQAWAADGSHRTVTEGVLKHTTVLAALEPAYDGTVATFRALAEATEAPVEDIDALMEALREGRMLDEAETNLLDRLGEAVRFKAPIPTTEAEPPPMELPARFMEAIAKADADFPRS